MRPFGSPTLSVAARSPEFVVTATQAAQMLGVTDHVLDDMRRRGTSPGYLLLGHGVNPTVLYREAVVLDWRNGIRTRSPEEHDAGTEHRDANVGRPPQPRPAPREVLGDVYISAVEVCRKIGGIEIGRAHV